MSFYKVRERFDEFPKDRGGSRGVPNIHSGTQDEVEVAEYLWDHFGVRWGTAGL